MSAIAYDVCPVRSTSHPLQRSVKASSSSAMPQMLQGLPRPYHGGAIWLLLWSSRTTEHQEASLRILNCCLLDDSLSQGSFFMRVQPLVARPFQCHQAQSGSRCRTLLSVGHMLWSTSKQGHAPSCCMVTDSQLPSAGIATSFVNAEASLVVRISCALDDGYSKQVPGCCRHKHSQIPIVAALYRHVEYFQLSHAIREFYLTALDVVGPRSALCFVEAESSNEAAADNKEEGGAGAVRSISFPKNQL